MLRHAILLSSSKINLDPEELLGALFASNEDTTLIDEIEDAQKILESMENADYLYIAESGEIHDQAAEFLTLMPCQAKSIYAWEDHSIRCYLCCEWAII